MTADAGRGSAAMITDSLPRNDPALYDHMADQWWPPTARFAPLHWLAASRARHVPPAPRPGAVLIDLACGGGVMAPHAQRLGYRHVGVDLNDAALRVARDHGVVPLRASVLAVPLADGSADVVVAGEILEHVADPAAVLAECARLLRRGGTLVLDTLANTAVSRFLMVTVAERVPGGAPAALHDPALFVDRRALRDAAGRLGLDLRLVGLRPSFRDGLAWLVDRRRSVRMLPTRWTSVVFAGYGRKL